MEIIRICRFLRNICSVIVIAGLITNFQTAVNWGIALYALTLVVSQLLIEGFFMAAYEDMLGGRNEQKSSREVGKGDVPKVGP